MISIISKKFCSTLDFLKESLDGSLIENSVYVSENNRYLSSQLKTAVISGEALFLVGDTSEFKTLFSESFGLTMFYDKFAEKNIEKYCELTGQPAPPQYLLDKLCSTPEAFVNYAVNFGFQSGCAGEYKKCCVYIFPSDIRESRVIYETYVKSNIEKIFRFAEKRIYKIFALGEKEIEDRLSQICNPRFVSHKCETLLLDSKITLVFKSKCPKNIMSELDDAMKKTFGSCLYADSDVLPEKLAVDALRKIHKTVAVAESLTGGLISSKIVDIPGASNVLYEGAVTYTVDAKCKRLGLNPHFVDKYGVVSSQVAQEMANGLLSSGDCDFAVAATGYAGPAAEDETVGLCFIAVGSTVGGTTVYRNIFSGDRRQIREQAASSALYLLFKTICK